MSVLITLLVLSGTVTDPSGAAIPGATVTVHGRSVERHTKTDRVGRYSFTSLAPGPYDVRVEARSFKTAVKKDLRVDQATKFDVRLAIRTERQVVNVQDLDNSVGTDPASNASALVLGRKQLAALSDDPTELAQQLEALAGPAPGPGGGQMYIDGFLGGNLPPKSAIREVRINANPFSPEYDRPGFGRIEVFTKPGSERFSGEAMVQYNNRFLNARNPLLTQAAPPYQAQLYRLNLAGPLRKNKASFTFDAERRQIAENALILATVLDDALKPLRVSESIATPVRRMAVTPRLDYTIDGKNTLVVRFQDVRIGEDNRGAGGFNLPSRAYNLTQVEHTVQVTETAAISPRAMNETRFQFMRSAVQKAGDDTTAAIEVQGAFVGGGAGVGRSRTSTDQWELTNMSMFNKGKHTYKWGGRVRGSRLADISFDNFAGTFTFFSLADYQQTLALGRVGAAQFRLNAGNPSAEVNQVDAGLFVNDDWRVRSNVTLSFGLRYEVQSNIGDRSDWAPRVGIAWALDGRPGRVARTVLRAGFGTFYNRLPSVATLNTLRYDGIRQQSFFIQKPVFFPEIPALSTLQANKQPQELDSIYRGIVAPRLYQSSIGIERQINQWARISANWVAGRGVHLLDARNVNAPVNGGYPFEDASIRLLTESAGVSRVNQLVVTPNVNYKGLVVFGLYALSFGKDDSSCVPTAAYSPTACAPSDPYNLRADWAPSTFDDVRNRMVLGLSIPLPRGFSVMPIVFANSGQPYNITSGLDAGGTGFATTRPSLDRSVGASACTGNALVYATGFGCFNLQPGPGRMTIGRNYGRGPATATLGLRISRTWAFGAPAETRQRAFADHDVRVPAGHATKYGVTVSASAINALNRTNLGPPNGDLSSPYFGQPLGLADVMGHMSGTSTYNRKIDLQVRVTF